MNKSVLAAMTLAVLVGGFRLLSDRRPSAPPAIVAPSKTPQTLLADLDDLAETLDRRLTELESCRRTLEQQRRLGEALAGVAERRGDSERVRLLRREAATRDEFLALVDAELRQSEEVADELRRTRAQAARLQEARDRSDEASRLGAETRALRRAIAVAQDDESIQNRVRELSGRNSP